MQPYLESGFPYGRDQFISTAGTGWATLVDVQWTTDHLATLGAVAIPRPEYL